MADLKQAMVWLAEGKKIRRIGSRPGFHLYLDYGTIYDCNDNRCNDLLYNADDWEIYEDKEVKACLVDDQNYIVWDKSGNRTFAYYDESEESFYSLVDNNAFALAVDRYKRLPGDD